MKAMGDSAEASLSATRRMRTRWPRPWAAAAREAASRELSLLHRVRAHRQQPAILCRSFLPGRQDCSVPACEGVQRIASTDSPVPTSPRNLSSETPACDDYPRLAAELWLGFFRKSKITRVQSADATQPEPFATW